MSATFIAIGEPTHLVSATPRTYHVLNLGVGVQSTTLALLAEEGKLLYNGEPVRLDAAVVADTKEEPRDPGHSVYEHLEKLRKKLSYPVIVRSAGKLGDDLQHGTGRTQRVASIPAFTSDAANKVSKVRRQCTAEYKIQVIEKAIRRDVAGIKPGGRFPKGVRVVQYIGISLDEAGRMTRAKKRLEEHPIYWSELRWPLVEQFGWTRADCRKYLETKLDYRVPRSACVFCPFHDNEEWAAIKARNGVDWARAVEVDRMLRMSGSVCTRKMNQPLFLHRSCKPIDEVQFSTDPGDSMAAECLGMCGN